MKSAKANRYLEGEYIEPVLRKWLYEASFFLGWLWNDYMQRKGSQRVVDLHEISKHLILVWWSYYGRTGFYLERKDADLENITLHGKSVFSHEMLGKRESHIQLNYSAIEKIVAGVFPQIRIRKCCICNDRRFNLSPVVIDDEECYLCDSCEMPLPPEHGVGFVYAFGSPDYGFVKIGASKNPQSRLSAHKKHAPFDIEMICEIPSDNIFRDEKRLHYILSEYSTRGEWFELTESLIEWIKGISHFQDGQMVLVAEEKTAGQLTKDDLLLVGSNGA